MKNLLPYAVVLGALLLLATACSKTYYPTPAVDNSNDNLALGNSSGAMASTASPYPGVNFTWVLLVDNSAVSKWVLAENTKIKAVAVERVTEEFNKFKERFRRKIDEMREEVAYW